MANNSIPHRVALALLELAREENRVADYQEALAKIDADFRKEPRLKEILGSYQIPFEELYALVEKVYGGTDLIHLVPFLKYLVSRRAIGRFDEIYESFLAESDKDLGISQGIVYSATPLPEEQKALLENTFGKLSGKKVRLHNRVEPSLIGGVRVFLDGKVYDGSLSAKIDRMREMLLTSTIQGGNE